MHHVGRMHPEKPARLRKREVVRLPWRSLHHVDRYSELPQVLLERPTGSQAKHGWLEFVAIEGAAESDHHLLQSTERKGLRNLYDANALHWGAGLLQRL